jgi:hypothetical protein
VDCAGIIPGGKFAIYLRRKNNGGNPQRKAAKDGNQNRLRQVVVNVRLDRIVREGRAGLGFTSGGGFSCIGRTILTLANRPAAPGTETRPGEHRLPTIHAEPYIRVQGLLLD